MMSKIVNGGLNVFNKQSFATRFFINIKKSYKLDILICFFQPFIISISFIMVFSKKCFGLISVAYVTLLAMNSTVLAAVIPRGVIQIVNGIVFKFLLLCILIRNLTDSKTIDNPISHKVSGNHGAVSVENEQCSNTGVDGNPFLKSDSIRHY